MKKYLLLIFCTFIFSQNIYSQPGSLDLNFGNNGIVLSNLHGVAYSVAIQGDDKIVVAGGSNVSSIGVLRLNTDGSLDSSFGVAGQINTWPGIGGSSGYSVVIQTDNKIIVAGYSNNSNCIVRYNSNGNLDNSFGNNGIVNTTIGSNSDGHSVALQNDGKILVAGRASMTTNDIALIRYNANGTLDNTFDTDGILTTAVGSGNDFGMCVAIQSDNKIVVAGSTTTSSGSDFVLIRYNTDGSLDSTFGSYGVITTDFNNSDDKANCLKIQADGKIVVSGSSLFGGYYAFAMVRYNNNGTMDNTFGTNGKVITDVQNLDDFSFSLAIQNNGKILLAGRSYSPPSYSYEDFALVRYNNNGFLDSTFGLGGIVITDLSSDGDAAFSVALQSTGQIIVAGRSSTSSGNVFSVARYDGDMVLGVRETPFEPSMLVYPNPSHNTLTISFNYQTKEENGELKIVNALGENVYKQKISSQLSNINYQLNPGIYFVTAKYSDRQFIKKIIIE